MRGIRLEDLERLEPALGQAEVQDLHLSGVRDEDVLGREIPVRDADIVRGRQAVRHVGCIADAHVDGQRPLVHQGPQARPVQQLRRHERDPPLAPHIEDVRDIRVVQQRARARLAPEAREVLAVGR